MWLRSPAPCCHADVPLLTYCLQELKSQQPQLPVAVASLLQQYGWLETCLAPQTDSAAAAHPQQGSTGSAAGSPGSAAAQAAACGGGGGAAAAAFSVPGITITSFHLQQLQASKQVRCSVCTLCQHKLSVKRVTGCWLQAHQVMCAHLQLNGRLRPACRLQQSQYKLYTQPSVVLQSLHASLLSHSSTVTTRPSVRAAPVSTGQCTITAFSLERSCCPQCSMAGSFKRSATSCLTQQQPADLRCCARAPMR